MSEPITAVEAEQLEEPAVWDESIFDEAVWPTKDKEARIGRDS